jgi:uncharacterized membrane protein YhdT
MASIRLDVTLDLFTDGYKKFNDWYEWICIVQLMEGINMWMVGVKMVFSQGNQSLSEEPNLA